MNYFLGKQLFAHIKKQCYTENNHYFRGDWMDYLSEKQKQVLQFIEDEVTRCNYPPSVREIGKALGMKSTATVHGYLDILEEKGYIMRVATKPRAIRILKNCDDDSIDKRCYFAPLVGRITAGQPILAEENREGYFPIPAAIPAGESCFVLKVEGESMIEAGINSGDYVIIKQQNTAENGDIVAALLDDEATIKRFYRENNRFKLQPENQAYEPIFTDHVEIIGKVIGLFRRF